MRIHLLVIGTKMPSWVQEASQDYLRRMPAHCAVHVQEISAEKRTRSSDLNALCEREGQKLIAAIPPGSRSIALDVRGKGWSTEQLAQNMESWINDSQDISLLVGGPEGLSKACLDQAEQRWSLSPLTFPHPLVRVIVAEQLFRAWSILSNHPYHRGG